MESIGKYLKAERESRNLSLKEVSESTRIKEGLLKAIEEDQYELLSSPVYVKGFLDAYARYLDLDPHDIVLRYQKYHGNKVLSKESELKQRFITSSKLRLWITFPKKGTNLWLFIVSISVIILFIVIFMYYTLIKPM
jgi:cytoskeletal protein RodZ